MTANPAPVPRPSAPPQGDVELLERLAAARADLLAQVGRRIVGQQDVLDGILTAVFSGGHAMLLVVPVLAKTLMVSTVYDQQQSVAAGEDGGEDAVEHVILADDAPAYLGEQVGARRREPLEQLDVALGRGRRTRHGRRICGHRVSKVITSYSQAPHKFAGLAVCLRNFSQAGSFGAVPSPGPLRYAGLGIQLAVTVVVCVLAGQWLDRKAGTDGIFTILTPLLGFGGTLYSLIRELAKTDRNGP